MRKRIEVFGFQINRAVDEVMEASYFPAAHNYSASAINYNISAINSRAEVAQLRMHVSYTMDMPLDPPLPSSIPWY